MRGGRPEARATVPAAGSEKVSENPQVVPWWTNGRSPRVGAVSPAASAASIRSVGPSVDVSFEDGATARVRAVGSDGAPPTELRFTIGRGRATVALVLLAGRREVDVSIQPGLVASVVGREGDAVAGHLAAFAARHGAWSPAEPAGAGLLDVVTGMTFPLLGAAIDRGASGLAEVPRWAAPVLAAPTARDAAQRAFSTRATRPVVAALAGGLVPGPAPSPDPRASCRTPAGSGGPQRPPTPAGRAPGGGGTHRGGPEAVRPPQPPDLFPLALGLMATALTPDRLARVLAADGPDRRPVDWPDGEVVALGCRHTATWGEHRTERVLRDAAELADGPLLLAEALRLQGLVGHRAASRLPNRLEPLRDELRALLPTDPNPHGLVAPPRRRPTRPARPATPPAAGPARRVVAPVVEPPPPTVDERRRAMWRAPATQGTAPPEHVPLHHPPAVLVLAGVEVMGAGGPLRLAVPRTGAELTAWGERLGNCVGGFAAAVNEGRSIVLGVEAGDRLAYCLEVRPDGGVRQFLAARNRPVPPADAAAVLAAVSATGLVRREAPGNDAWFEASPTG